VALGQEEAGVKTGCFGCDQIIEADDPEAVADRFVAHAAESHNWSYPEEALRNYARNYAEASERLTGGTERLSEIGEITVHSVTEDRIDDWLDFFDHDGFAGNPDWAACYCLEPHNPGTEEDPERLWSDNRAAMAERLRTGGAFGYLAYVDGKTAGWVNASPRSDYALYRLVDPDGPDPASVIGVSCFVIAPPFRRHGVAAALLDYVIVDSPARGASWIEGYPHNEPEEGDSGHFRGPRSMYDARGFEPVEVREGDTVMRRPAS
jgi:GNAT superfamily N-acetyltransferase